MGTGPTSIPPGAISNFFGIGRCVAWSYLRDDGLEISADYEVGEGGDREVPFAG
jgi:hypothetical protein